MKNRNLIIGEHAITPNDTDLLNYSPFAKKIQTIIQGYSNNSEPLTIGIYGKWGSGKTSFLNLIEKHIEIFHKQKEDKPYIKFHYTPWLYQNKEEMLFDFFESLHRKLIYSGNENLKKAGKFIKKYSRYLKAVKLSASIGVPKMLNAGISIEPYEILQRLGEDIEGEDKGLEELKIEINNILNESDKKIIIFIDDIDRLDKDEIFTLFKLIKINADFKNLIFIICLDPEHVAKAIHHRYGNNKKSGIDFLEKIINIPLELPLIEKSDLDFFLREKLTSTLQYRRIKQIDLDELLESIDGKYFDSPREIIRIINSFSISFYAIGQEVNPHDLFWIEYLKIKHNKAYQLLKNHSKKLVSETIFKPIVNLNENDYYSDNKTETGLRKKLMDKFPDSYKIIDFLFRMDRKGTLSAYQNQLQKSEKTLDIELRVSHLNHYEKYFSYHTKGKFSESSFSIFKQQILESKTEESLDSLHLMIKNTNERKVVYRLKSEIETLTDTLIEKLIIFLLKNISVFKESSGQQLHSIDIIRTISKRLNQIITIENYDSIFKTVNQELDYIKLSWFIGLLSDQKFKSEKASIEKIIVDKLMKSDNHPFFKNRSTSVFIMRTWFKIDKDKFKEYIYSHLNNKENLSMFLKCFTYFWNGEINGIFKESDYHFLSKEINLDNNIIAQKVLNIYPEILELNKSDDSSLNFDDYVNNTTIQNARQFMHWHEKATNLKD